MKLYGIGVGPGDPELLTRKAENVLRRIPLLFTPTMSDHGISRAHQVVKEVIAPSTRVIPLRFPHFGAPTFEESMNQVWHTMTEALLTVEEAAFIVIGDITLYSSYFQAVPHLKKRIKALETELIPGLSAHQVAAARCEIPLVQENERLVICSGYDQGPENRSFFEAADTVVLYKADREDDLARFLLQNPWYSCRKLCTRLCLPEETIQDLDEMNLKKRDYFTVALLKK